MHLHTSVDLTVPVIGHVTF